MKYIIIGLGNFGASLSEKLTRLGNEVIGVDSQMSKVEALKHRITHTICLDCTDASAVSSLPLKDTDITIVAIGEDLGANIMATALLKQLKVKRLISRAVSPLQETVLQAMEVDEIIHPEEETAERWAKKLNTKGVVDSFEISGDYSIVEITVPNVFIGKTIEEIGFRRNYAILVLTVIGKQEQTNMLGLKTVALCAQGVASPDTVLKESEILVIYGKNNDIQKLLDKYGK